jgi:cytidine deaminase
MSFDKVQKLMRKTRRSMGRNAEFYVFNVTTCAEQPVGFQT